MNKKTYTAKVTCNKTLLHIRQVTYYNMYDHKSEKIKMQHRYGVVQQILTKIH